ncbi:MAG: hypothetical protein ABSH24_03470 [Bryobacteraceae bacterium]
MSIYLVVSVLDAYYNPLDAKRVSLQAQLSSHSASTTRLTSTGKTGEYKVKLTPGVNQFTINVHQDGFFPMHQDLMLNPGPPPSLSYTGGIQELNARGFGGVGRTGGDWTVSVTVVLGQLQDARATMVSMGIGSIDASAYPNPVMDFSGKNALNATGAGWNKFAHTLLGSVTPTGKMLYASGINEPKFLAIYLPPGVTVTPKPGGSVDPQKSPLNFHLFYPPWTGVLTGSYPFGPNYIDFIRRYLFFYPFFHKEMANQQEASQAKPVFLFPIASSNFPQGFSQTQILRLLYEVKYFVQRMDNIPYPLQPVGKCAVSGFSYGGIGVNLAITNTDSGFHNNVLKEVYGFDLRQVGAQAFATKLSAWFNGGGDRIYRIYTTANGWYQAFRSVDSSAVQNMGAGGAVEWQGARSSLVYVPGYNFWKGIQDDVNSGSFLAPAVGKYQTFSFPSADPKDPDKDVHQLMPAIFLEHALKNSSLK